MGDINLSDLGRLFTRCTDSIPIFGNNAMIMKKKVLIGIVLVAVITAAGFFVYRATRPSPPGSAELTVGGLTVSVSYSRPSVRGRLIFGSKEQKALQPYGEYWRLGANKATQITLSNDVTFNGQSVKAGTYRMYAIPGPDSFEIALNTELGKSGAEMPDHQVDMLQTKVPVTAASTPVEKFTISMTEAQQGIDVVFEWSTVRFVIPIRPQ
jgi:hypothetical protein